MYLMSCDSNSLCLGLGGEVSAGVLSRRACFQGFPGLLRWCRLPGHLSPGGCPPPFPCSCLAVIEICSVFFKKTHTQLRGKAAEAFVAFVIPKKSPQPAAIDAPGSMESMEGKTQVSVFAFSAPPPYAVRGCHLPGPPPPASPAARGFRTDRLPHLSPTASPLSPGGLPPASPSPPVDPDTTSPATRSSSSMFARHLYSLMSDEDGDRCSRRRRPCHVLISILYAEVPIFGKQKRFSILDFGGCRGSRGSRFLRRFLRRFPPTQSKLPFPAALVKQRFRAQRGTESHITRVVSVDVIVRWDPAVFI